MQFQFSKQWLLLPRQLMLERMHLLLWQTLRKPSFQLLHCEYSSILSTNTENKSFTLLSSLYKAYYHGCQPTQSLSLYLGLGYFMFFLLLSEGVLKNSRDFSDCKPHLYTFLMTFIILIIFNLALSHQSGFGLRGSN